MNLTRRLKAGAILAGARSLRAPFALAGSPVFPDQPRRILVLKPCCLGDVLMATPVVGALRQHYPEATIDFAVGQFARVIAEHNPHIDSIVDCGRIGWGKRYPLSELLDFVKTVRSRRYDVCFVLDRSPLTQAIPLLAGIPVRVGIDSGGRGFSLTHATFAEPVRHEVDLYLDTLRAVGIDPVDPRLEFVPSEEDRQFAAVLLGAFDADDAAGDFSGTTICLHPAGGENPGMTFIAKRWTPEGYAAVASEVLSGGGRIVIVGSPGEREVSHTVAAQTAGDRTRLLDLTGQTTLPQLAAVIERCDAFLGNDTGPMHLACAVGTPTVAIFGPSNPVMYPPYSPVAELVYQKVYCSPCLKDGLYDFAPDCVQQCMRNIAPRVPIAALSRLLQSAADARMVGAS